MNNTRCLCFSLFALFTSSLYANDTPPCKEIVYYAKSLIEQQEQLMCYDDGTLQVQLGVQSPFTVAVQQATWWRVIQEADTFSAGLSFTHHALRYTLYTIHLENDDLAGLIITRNTKLIRWVPFEPRTVLHVIDNHLTHFGLKEYRPFPHRH